MVMLLRTPTSLHTTSKVQQIMIMFLRTPTSLHTTTRVQQIMIAFPRVPTPGTPQPEFSKSLIIFTVVSKIPGAPPAAAGGGGGPYGAERGVG